MSDSQIHTGQISNRKKPTISYWKSSDPCLKLDILKNKLTEINVILTKTLSDEFILFCIQNKSKIFLHINITGMGKSIFEPNISTVKETFFAIKKLIDGGFSQKQILVLVNPVLPNDNGLNALKLLLKVFTEFKILRLRTVRLQVMNYVEFEPGKFTIGNYNIAKRPTTKQIQQYLFKNPSFFKDYFKLIEQYQSIISVDKGEESLIGIRELLPFGYKNEWIDSEGNRTKLIEYENNNRFKPIVNIISNEPATRCSNRCLLCPHKY